MNVNGCVDLQGGLAANAGADGSFLDLFNDSTMVPIFDENFQLFQVRLDFAKTAQALIQLTYLEVLRNRSFGTEGEAKSRTPREACWPFLFEP